MKIIIDDLTGSAIAALLQQHHQDMLSHSPVESVHALDLSALQAPDITFWSAWIDNQLAGCGALKMLNNSHGEIKSMRTSSAYLRQGVAKALLAHIIEHAKATGLTQISLETGSMAAFIPAQQLYREFGFNQCVPFADYQLDRFSLFMTRAI